METRKISRKRVGVAVGLLVALASGLVVTSRMRHSPVADPAPRPQPARAASSPITARAAVELRQLRASVPDRSICSYDPATAGAVLRCSLDGVVADYRLVGAADVNALYLAVAGPLPHPSRSEIPGCLRGVAEERGWATAARPHVTAGRFACRIEGGVPEMWWTVADRGLLVHAIETRGGLARLFEWWLSHAERWTA